MDTVDGALPVLACGVDAVVVDVPGYPDSPQVVTYLAVDRSGNMAQAMYRWVTCPPAIYLPANFFSHSLTGPASQYSLYRFGNC